MLLQRLSLEEYRIVIRQENIIAKSYRSIYALNIPLISMKIVSGASSFTKEFDPDRYGYYVIK